MGATAVLVSNRYGPFYRNTILTQVGRQVVFEVEWRREWRGRQQGGRRWEIESTSVVRMVMMVTPEQVGCGRCSAVEHERRGCCVVGHPGAGGPVGSTTAERTAADRTSTNSTASAAVSRYCRYLTRSQGHQFHDAFNVLI